jgi:hypothetical protein
MSQVSLYPHKEEGRPLGRPSQTFTQKVPSETNLYFFFLHVCEVESDSCLPLW